MIPYFIPIINNNYLSRKNESILNLFWLSYASNVEKTTFSTPSHPLLLPLINRDAQSICSLGTNLSGFGQAIDKQICGTKWHSYCNPS